VPGSGCWLTTERLGLRRFTSADFEWLHALYRDPEVMRYLGGPKDRAHVETLLETRILRYYDEPPGLGVWMTLERATDTPVGLQVLNHVQGETLVLRAERRGLAAGTRFRHTGHMNRRAPANLLT
jgi:RimJ/RimL family protein N-acetyltransferase